MTAYKALMTTVERVSEDEPYVVWWFEKDPVTAKVTRHFRDFDSKEAAEELVVFLSDPKVKMAPIKDCPWHPPVSKPVDHSKYPADPRSILRQPNPNLADYSDD